MKIAMKDMYRKDLEWTGAKSRFVTAERSC